MKNLTQWTGVLYIAAALALYLPRALAAEMIGNCEVTGQKGQYSFNPMIPGQLTVRANLPSPGWWNGDTPDAVKDGFEYCMAANMAYRLGLEKVTVVYAAWAQVIAGSARNFDLTLSQASITEPRKKTVDFSEPYFVSDIGVLTKKGSGVDAGNLKSKRIGVYQGTTGADFVASVPKAQQVSVYPNVPAMIAALTAGQVDAVLDDTTGVLAQARKSNGLLEAIGQFKTGEAYGAIYSKGSPNEAVFDKVLQSLIDDGTLQKLSAKYLAAAWGDGPAGEWSKLEMEMQAMRIGDAAFVAVPLEPFAHTRAVVRERSPFPVTHFAGYANGLIGPEAVDFPIGGYEVEWAGPFTEAAAEVLIAEAIITLNDLMQAP
jgi:polar amino acid transport system substrate-binding protein